MLKALFKLIGKWLTRKTKPVSIDCDLSFSKTSDVAEDYIKMNCSSLLLYFSGSSEVIELF